MIRVTRGKAWSDKLRAYKIFIDDDYCGDINENETKEFPVETGSHTIYAKIDWCSSNKLNVIVSDSPLELEVGPTLAGKKFWIPFYQHLTLTLWRKNYLWIKDINE